MPTWTRRDFISALATAYVLPGGSNDAFAAKPSPPLPTTPVSNGPVPPLDLLVLSRLTFGPRTADYEAYLKSGRNPRQRLENFLEQQLHPAKIVDTDCESRIARMNLPTLNKSLDQLWKDHVVAADEIRDGVKAEAAAAAPILAPGTPAGTGVTAMPATTAVPKDEKTKMEGQLRLQPARETEQGTWLRAVYSQRQLNEVLANFWHDHFNVFAYEVRVSAVFVHYDRDVIRKNMYGNFRAFLEAVAQSPAMLHYLDNELNQSGNPNENFARELFELHTLGAENYLGTMDRQKVPGFLHGAPAGYVDGDVYEAARALTGWRTEGDRKGPYTGHFEYFEPWHDRFQKIVLGRPFKEYQPPLKDGRDVLDLVAHHPGTARYLCRKLCRRFVSDQPSEALVERIAKVFRENQTKDDQLLRVIRAILFSEEFAASGGQKFKRPFDYVAGLLRQSDAEFTPTQDFINNFERTGQRLFAWHTPDGTPDLKEKWASPNSLQERWRLTCQLLGGQFPATKIPSLEGKPLGGALHVAYWEKRVFPEGISAATRNTIVAYAGNNPDPQRARAAVALLFQSPEYQWR